MGKTVTLASGQTLKGKAAKAYGDSSSTGTFNAVGTGGGKVKYDKGQIVGGDFETTAKSLSRKSSITQTPAPLGSDERTTNLGAMGTDPVTGQQTVDQGQGVTSLKGGSVNQDAWANNDPSAMQAPALNGATANMGAVTTAPQSPGQAAAAAARQAGVAPPTSGGLAGTQLAQFTSQKEEQPMIAQDLATTDPYLQNLQKQITDYFDPKSQRDSLTKTYSQMIKKAGLPELDTELMNMKNVIDGSEDDIRNEVTKAGGFATESQVMALTNSRNKQMVKNYNTLLESRNTQMEYVNTMMSLASQDKQMANQQFSTMMNFQFQIADYKMKMQDNAMKQYDRQIAAIGYDGLLQTTGGDPYYQSLIEKTMGLPQGGLKIAADRATETRLSDLSDKALDRQYKGAQIANINSQIAERGRASTEGTLNGKPQTQAQAHANTYADRIGQSNTTVGKLGSKFTGLGSYATGKLTLGVNFLKSAERQSYEQAQRNFYNALLRQESGAVISPTEFEEAKQQYFPQPGDDKLTMDQKAINRTTAINGLYRESNLPTPMLSGMARVGPDGNTYYVK